MIDLNIDYYPSPIGSITLLFAENTLCYLDFSENDERLERLMTLRYGPHRVTENPSNEMRMRLDGYFAKDWSSFEGLPIQLVGTPFQKLVWQHLQTISPGTTYSYQDLARSIGKPKAIRAAASSNANNPIAIIVPCHRVIGKNGALRGYAGGLFRKKWLLEHEGITL